VGRLNSAAELVVCNTSNKANGESSSKQVRVTIVTSDCLLGFFEVGHDFGVVGINGVSGGIHDVAFHRGLLYTMFFLRAKEDPCPR